MRRDVRFAGIDQHGEAAIKHVAMAGLTSD